MRVVCGVVIRGDAIRIVSLDLEENGAKCNNWLRDRKVSVCPVNPVKPNILIRARERCV